MDNRKAIFLDRDGVINRERGEYTYRIEDFEFVDGLFDALRALKQEGYEFVVITNQSGIAKGIYEHDDVLRVMNYMTQRFSEENIEILDYYYSPHHEDYGMSLDRKPGSLLIEKALARFGIDAKRSYIIGDSERDIIAGEAVGLKGVKVDPNQDLRTVLKTIVDG